MALKVALQLYSVRNDMANDYVKTMTEVAKMGYQGVEFAGFIADPAEMGKLARNLGMEPISCHYTYGKIVENPEKAFADCLAAGCKFIVIPYMTEEYRPDGAEFDKACEDMKILGKAAKDHGLTLLYHNHDFEFVKLGDEYGIDVMYNRVPACLLQTELDTCWVNVAGENPANFVLKYSGRAPVVHLKDFHMPAVKPEKMYALIGIDDGEAEEEKGEDDVFGFRPVGYGMQDVPAIIAASEKAGASWLVVEQDNPSMGKTPLECVKMSIEYLRA
jgi:sugar phosphate isomerase/epimerase